MFISSWFQSKQALSLVCVCIYIYFKNVFFQHQSYTTNIRHLDLKVCHQVIEQILERSQYHSVCLVFSILHIQSQCVGDKAMTFSTAPIKKYIHSIRKKHTHTEKSSKLLSIWHDSHSKIGQNIVNKMATDR